MNFTEGVEVIADPHVRALQKMVAECETVAEKTGSEAAKATAVSREASRKLSATKAALAAYQQVWEKGEPGVKPDSVSGITMTAPADRGWRTS